MSIAPSVHEFLTTEHVPFTTFTHRMAFTAQEEAAVAHVPGRTWAKTVVCFADDEPVLVVVPATAAVDFNRVRHLAGAEHVRLAREREIADLYPGCEVGAMPPLGPLFHQRVYVDRILARQPEIVFNAGTHVDAIRMRYEDFAGLVHPTVGDLGIEPAR
jgi:Ala-tRNA(Pro) deacylase